MSMVLPQVALVRVIKEGLEILREHPEILNDIFDYYTVEPISQDYGYSYIESIKTWFLNTKIPVVQAWSMNMAQVPQIAIKLANEQEDESKAALGDFIGDGHTHEVGGNTFVVTLDIALHASKNTDEVLWLYYIVHYILFKRKLHAEALGLRLQTFGASDYLRDVDRSAENIWVRTIKYKATVENFWAASKYLDIDHMRISTTFEEAEEQLDD